MPTEISKPISGWVSGWGRYPVIETQSIAASSFQGAQSALSHWQASGFISRALGRSYGDSSLAAHTLDMSPLDHFLSFDRNAGVLECEAGVSLKTILDVIIPAGWFLPVTPGTQFVSIGGAIASDVHGKNHHQEGCFSQHVLSFNILVGSGDIITCSAAGDHTDLFRATCGGMGLTGIILSARIQLKPIKSSWIDQTLIKTANLNETIEAFRAHAASTYSVAWIDCLAQGKAMGRSIVMLGEHSASGDLAVHTPSLKLNIPVTLPNFVLNRYSIQLFNTLYYGRIRRKRIVTRSSYLPYFYPLDAISNWNRMYGRSGFTQYQFVIPEEEGSATIGKILSEISRSQLGSFLAVLKSFGPENANYLSFPQKGLTLALDFKISPALFALLPKLDALVIDAGGRIYLSKDVCMSAQTFKTSYPRWEAFNQVCQRYGSAGIFKSLQSERLGLT